MLGAIAGDIVGSVFERSNRKTKDFALFSSDSSFTDDTVLTVALADAILTGRDYRNLMKEYVRRYPNAGYGALFRQWALSDGKGPYGSFGNGAAMRISPVGWAFHELDDVLEKARECTVITHDHPEGIKGAQATAAAVFLAKTGASRKDIKEFIETSFRYDLSRSLAQIRPDYRFDPSCQGTVPPAIRAFLESIDFEDAIRNAVSLGGDSDTLACITGAIAEAFYAGLPRSIGRRVWEFLTEELKAVTLEFREKYVLYSVS